MIDTTLVVFRLRDRRTVYGPHPKPFSLRLLELAEQLQPKLTDHEYKQLCDLTTRARGRAARATGERALTLGRGSLPAGPLIGGNRGCPDQTHAWPQPRPVDACRRTGIDAGYFGT